MNGFDEFSNLTLTRFLEEVVACDAYWLVKRLSGNDTNLTGAHQVGIYVPRSFCKRVFPRACTISEHNPDSSLEDCYFPADDYRTGPLRCVYYNSKYFPELELKKKYDEFRITRWGGRNAPVQNPENTGSVFVFAVLPSAVDGLRRAIAWVASSIEEEELIENWVGAEVEPGMFYQRDVPPVTQTQLKLPCEWLHEFPSGKEIFEFVCRELPFGHGRLSVDRLLLKRREFEFSLFAQLESEHVLPVIEKGFSSVDTFVKYSHSVSNRRKARSGSSLESNLAAIFTDFGLAFDSQVKTEHKKRPDFIFPSGKAYHDSSFPSELLRMMAAKTCCKDRWRQVINEADRINAKHLFTLQEGVSGDQLGEMHAHKVKLVVPKPHLSSFPKDWRSRISTLEKFVGEVGKNQDQINGLDEWLP